ncbi:MAG: hypothetical protein ACI841_003838 [Planctomycetota bacterium]|jgi:hypothetical protein
MKFVIILVLVAVMAGLVIAALRKKDEEKSTARGRRSGGALEPPQVHDLTIKDAVLGDSIVVSGAAEDFSDINFTIDRVHQFRSGRDRWAEISGIDSGRRFGIEWVDDDELEVSLDRGLRMKIGDLGLTEDDLARFDEEESASNTVEHDGTRFSFSESGEVFHSRAGGEDEGFYSWEFEAEDGRSLWIEKWEGESFQAGISASIRPDSVSVFRA